MIEQNNIVKLRELAVKVTGISIENIQGNTIADILDFINKHYVGGGGVNITNAEINLDGDGDVNNGLITMSDGSTVDMVTTVIDTLKLTSSEGTSAGQTVIKVTEPLTNGNKYKYKVSVKVLPAKNQDLSSWTDWNGVNEIMADSGVYLYVAECTSNDRAVRCGKVEVVSSLF